MKYLLILSILILSIQANSQDIAKFRSIASTYQVYENGEWGEWSDWDEENDIITVSTEVVKVHKKEVERFDVTELVAEKREDGDIVFSHYSVDDSGRDCRVDLFSNADGTYEISFWYNEKIRVMHDLNLIGNLPDIYQKSELN